MKRLFVAVILLLSISLSSYAGGPADAPRFNGVESFNKSFPHATVIDYKNKADFTEVNFLWNGLRLQAFYDEDGDLVATCRAITIDNLPLPAQMRLRSDYAGFVLHDAIEFDHTVNGVSYFVTAVNPKNTMLLQIASDGTISVFSKKRN